MSLFVSPMRGVRAIRPVRAVALLGVLATIAAAPLFGATPEELKAQIEANAGDPFLQRDREDDIRALASINSVDAVRVMIPLLADPFEHIRERTILELRRISEVNAIKTLAVEGTHKTQPDEIRVNACEVFERMARPEVKAGLTAAMPALLAAMDDRDPRVAAAAVRAVVAIAEALPELLDEDGRELFVDLANKGKDMARPAAIVGCAKLGLFDQIKKPAKLVGDKDAMVKVAALDAAALIDHPDLFAWISEALDDKRDPIARMAALQNIHVALAQGHDEALQGVIDALEDDDWRVRQTAIDACIECWRGELLAPLVKRVEEEKSRLRLDAIKALRLMTGDDRGADHEGWKMLINTYVPLGTRELGSELERGEYGEWPSKAAEEKPMDPNATAAMFCELPIFSDRVMFVFDFSGSMRDPSDSDDDTSLRKIDIAKREMKATLDALPEKARFNVFIYRYYSTHPTSRARTPPDCIELQRAFEGPLLPANARGKAVGGQFIDAAEPLGWGNFYGALSEAFEDADVDTIYFLADGRPSRGRHCVEQEIYRALVRDNRFRRVAVNTVLTGSAGADEEFMDTIAAITWGASSAALK